MIEHNSFAGAKDTDLIGSYPMALIHASSGRSGLFEELFKKMR
jgi:hypothetical protein